MGLVAGERLQVGLCMLVAEDDVSVNRKKTGVIRCCYERLQTAAVVVAAVV